MDMPEQPERELIEKFFTGRCSPEEEELVRLFLRKPESEALLDEVLTKRAGHDLELFQQDAPLPPGHQDWKKTIAEKTGNQPPTAKGTIHRKFFAMRSAAIWIAVVLAGLSIYTISHFRASNVEPAAFVERINPRGQRSMILLPDSSVVYLGADSRLRYPERFSSASREIFLSGEAFFEVTKNPKKPFMVHTGKVQTKVLGTSFKIEAFANRPLMVQVATGKVRVDQIDGKYQKSLAILIPGETVFLDHGRIKNGKMNPEEVRDLKASRLTFNGKSLQEIADVLQRWYNVRITFKRISKAKERMTLTLDASVSIDKILNVLASAGHFRYAMKNGEIMIR
jgi:ferric-dicitrate binding protein FerR (iron transport regulator)